MRPVFLVAAILLVAFFAPPAHSAPALGPEVVVFEISFPREKERQRVVFGLYDSVAPATVENFKNLARGRFYRGLRFHRAFPGTLVQTGDPRSRHGQMELSGTGGPGFTLPAEINAPVKANSLAMARLPDRINPARVSNGSQFFVALEDMPALNGQYTVFGEVLEGREVLERISNTRTDSNDFPLEKIIIRRTSVEPRFLDRPAPTPTPAPTPAAVATPTAP
jgi:cyclophilin family peptidyl-prolyl cis-trans isomerase